jgi:hypothetical protein
LNSYAFYITQSGGPTTGQSLITSNSSNYASASPFTAFFTFSSPSSLPANSFDVAATQSPSATTGPTGTPLAGNPNVRQILLGTVTLTYGEATTFTLESITQSPGDSSAAGTDGNTLTLPAVPGQTYDLDLGGTQSGGAGAVSFTGADLATYTFTVTATPEPSSLLLAAVGSGSGLALAAWRRWRNRLSSRECQQTAAAT